MCDRIQSNTSTKIENVEVPAVNASIACSELLHIHLTNLGWVKICKFAQSNCLFVKKYRITKESLLSQTATTEKNIIYEDKWCPHGPTFEKKHALNSVEGRHLSEGKSDLNMG